jgi:hypothetical protein
MGSEAEMPSTKRMPPSCALIGAAAILQGCGDLERAAGVPSHLMCSAVFVGGLDPDMF